MHFLAGGDCRFTGERGNLDRDSLYSAGLGCECPNRARLSCSALLDRPVSQGPPAWVPDPEEKRKSAVDFPPELDQIVVALSHSVECRAVGASPIKEAGP